MGAIGHSGAYAKLIDDDQLQEKLNKMERRLRNKHLRPAVGKALRPIVKTAKNLVPSVTGALKSTIRGKVYQTKQGKRASEINGMVTAGGKVYRTEKGRIRLARSKKQRALAKAQGDQRVDYAMAIEYGRQRRRPFSARPFLRPAMARHREQAIKEITEAVRKSVAEAFGN